MSETSKGAIQDGGMSKGAIQSKTVLFEGDIPCFTNEKLRQPEFTVETLKKC